MARTCDFVWRRVFAYAIEVENQEDTHPDDLGRPWNPGTRVIMRQREEKTGPGVGGDMKTQAETAAMWPQVKQCPWLTEARGGEQQLLPGPLEGAQCCQHLDLRDQGSRATRGYISAALKYHFVEISWQAALGN